MHAAVYDAVNAIVKTHAEYLVKLSAPRHASVSAAAAQAAHDVLIQLYPSQTAMLDTDLATSLASVPDGQAKSQGVSVGAAAAAQILSRRSNDGSGATPIPYTPGTNPGDYQLTPPAFAQPVFTHWQFVTPFALRRANQFRPAPPPALTSPAYVAAFNEVMSLGEIGSTTRTADQTQIAKFWAAPIQNYWNEIAQTVAVQHGNTLPQNARLFALLDLTLADSVIAFYDAKYTYHFWRPVTAIRAQGTAAALAATAEASGADPTEFSGDAFRSMAADANWTPLANTALDPSYPGAHAVVSAAAADVLAGFFRNDHDAFAVTSEVLPGVLRSFTSFSAAANEASDSRIFAGQHFRTDQVAGQLLGRHIADYVLQNFLTATRPGYH
ncbi:MAG TPA: vanadium-dependent haloperoxidase [Gaiellaceae bacterium]|nr:vanadium-dependent haloperoxidase [Gaiellaceae bacterium]